MTSLRLLCLAAVACSPAASDPAPASPTWSDERFDDMTALALGRTLDPPTRAQTLAALRTGKLTLEQYIDTLVRDPAMSREIVPHMILGWLDFGPYSFILPVLQKDEIDGVAVYRLKTRGNLPGKPCKASEAVDVAPWWDLKTTIKVCPVDYQPTALVTKDGNVCTGASALSDPGFICGCGPNLINCTIDPMGMGKSFHQETTRTIAHVVENDLPFKQVLLTPYSFRDRNVAFAYERDHVYQGRIAKVPDLSRWPVEGKWAPRVEDWPGAHAGILTNRQFLWMSDGPRDRMRQIFERFWCTVPTSFGVDIETFRGIVHGATDLRYRGERWKQIAAQDGCTKCHARMDYGMQFFSGYPAISTAVTAIPGAARPKERGAFYGEDLDDKRGEGNLTARNFAELLVAQPEFSNCMVEHVEKHVLGMATPDERAELVRVFQKTERMRPLFATALRLYMTRQPAVAEPAAAPRAAKPTGASVPLGDGAVRALEEACGDCHSGDDKLGFLAKLGETRHLDRERLILMGNVISAGLMPKNEPLVPAARRALLAHIAESVAPDDAWARDALAYWAGDNYVPSRVHHIGALRARILAELPGAKDDTNPRALVDQTFERGLLVMTPAYVMEMSKLAIKACAHVAEADRLDCYRKATRPDVARAE